MIFKFYILIIAFGYSWRCIPPGQSVKERCSAQKPEVIFYKDINEASKDYFNMPSDMDKARLYEIEIYTKWNTPEISIREVSVQKKQQYDIVLSTKGVYIWP